VKSIRAADYVAQHFSWSVTGKVGTITLNRPERKNPLTFDSYGELRDFFRELRYASDVKAIVITGADGNFCSGGDVHEIIGPLVALKAPELLMFTRMTGDLVRAMRACWYWRVASSTCSWLVAPSRNCTLTRSRLEAVASTAAACAARPSASYSSARSASATFWNAVSTVVR